ncbi:MAG: asparagine synthase (glutamine-hydrolyzing) [Planctomycetaceae bacterium]
MCGLTGAAWLTASRGVSPDELERMTNVIAHRGPDDQQTWFSEQNKQTTAALGHRRLSIIDLDNSQQPLSNEDGSITVAFNGEIYNYRELREQLISKGHTLRTDGDTETIVHLYEEYGEKCVEHLRGMFAFALWDQRQERLLLARDRMGQKPLYYRVETDRVLFGSELKCLLQVENAPRNVNLRSVDLYLTYQYVPYPHCILEGYNQLPPAHTATWSRNNFEVSRYWSPGFEATGTTRRNWSEELRQTLTEAVQLRMRSDVPLGAFLSGGVDSTLIVGLMSQLSDQPVRTFAIGSSEARFDERSFARQASELHKTDHTELVVEPSALDILPDLIWHFDEPFADSSAIPTMHLSRLTRKGVTVSLSGDGGDELFLGYDRYRAVRIASMIDKIPGPLQSVFGLGRFIPASVQQRSFRRRLKRLLDGLSLSPRERYLTWIAIFSTAQRDELFTSSMREQLGDHNADSFLFDAYDSARTPNGDFVSETAFADTISYLPCDIMTKVDRATMSCGLEARSPLLDHKVVELAVAMPRDVKQTLKVGKKILKETFADLLPADISNRPKMGFGVPIDIWFRGELKEMLHDVLLDSTSQQRGMFDSAVVSRLIEEHTLARSDHAYKLWSLLILELWMRRFVD